MQKAELLTLTRKVIAAVHQFEVLNSESLGGWEKIFPCWFNELDRTLGLTRGQDAQYVHAEHGNIHLFAIAANIAGYATLREVIGGRDGASRGGRLDLCLVSEQFLDLVEAKWLDFDLLSPRLDDISVAVQSANKDVGIYRSDGELFKSANKTTRRSGITFLTPHLKLKPEEEFDANKISSLVNEIKILVQPDILAWSFPEKAAKLHYWNKYWPGVIAIIKRSM